MRTPLVAAALLALAPGLAASTAQAAEPSMSFYYSLMPGVSAADCLQRARNAFTSQSFTLAEATQNSQYATSGDYIALASCAPAQPTVFFITVSGPVFARADELLRSVRDIVRPGAAQPTRPPQQQPQRPAK